MRSTLNRLTLLALLAACILAPPARAAEGPGSWTFQDLFASPTPFALGHRGYGANPGTDPSLPIENTLDAFHHAFRDGIRVVELDLQLTADGKVVVFHDDYLEDMTCVNSLTYGELHARQPHVPLFGAVLASIRHFGRRDALGGLIFAEIKVPVPLCDGANTSEAAAISESKLVAAVVAEIRRARMEGQVMINAGSPTILRHAAEQAPDIPRALSLNVLQLLPPEVVAQLVNLPVTLIPKNDFGLAWYNIGPIARLPAIPSFPGFVGLSLAVGSKAVSIDKLVLLQAGASAPAVVAGLHGAGLKAVVWTVDAENEWSFVAAAGADGITTNNIAMGLARQAPLAPLAQWLPPETFAQAAADGGATAAAADGPAILPARSRATGTGAAQVEFALPDGGPARLGLLDVAGRLVESREVGSLGAGRHSVALGQSLSPGVYFARLEHARGRAQGRVIVVR